MYTQRSNKIIEDYLLKFSFLKNDNLWWQWTYDRTQGSCSFLPVAVTGSTCKHGSAWLPPSSLLSPGDAGGFCGSGDWRPGDTMMGGSVETRAGQARGGPSRAEILSDISVFKSPWPECWTFHSGCLQSHSGQTCKQCLIMFKMWVESIILAYWQLAPFPYRKCLADYQLDYTPHI